MRYLWFVAAVALAAGIGAEDDKKGPSEKVRAFLGGERVVGIIAGATRVEVFRVFPEKPNEPMGKECGGYPVISTGKERDREFAGKVAAILLDEKTYDFEKAKKCKFEPGVGFRLWREKDWVDVTLCFHCDELEISSKKPDEKELRTSHEDFDAARAALVKLVKEAFPDDKEIQALEDKRGK
ncbi:MAG: hypothetical protein HYY18_14115 [Planctomycetes bacterium]|nr:hypothetical protein [Planctomycetota bacterium]